MKRKGGTMAGQPLEGDSTDGNVPGVKGTNSADAGVGVQGISTGSGAGSIGVIGTSADPDEGIGVKGIGAALGVHAIGSSGIMAESNSAGGTALSGFNLERGKANGFIAGKSPFTDSAVGVFGQSNDMGVMGIAGNTGSENPKGVGVYGGSVGGVATGVIGDTNTGVAGVLGRSFGPGKAGKFEGNVEITGNLNMIGANSDIILQGADCAEDFDIVDMAAVEPGTVMVIDSESALLPSSKAYDKRVAGVVCGVGSHKPGIVLDKRQTQSNRMPIALVGKVFCKVDARYSPIEVGDLLTTSDSPGYAMKAENHHKAFGSVIGKALRPLQTGQGLIPVLIALQ
jgi:hypothetical protein